MNKKILTISIVAVFMLLAISMASAVNTTTPVKKKESPLFGIRTRRAINEKIGEIIENIKTKYIGQRVFFLQFLWLTNGDGISARQRLQGKYPPNTFDQRPGCQTEWHTLCPYTSCDECYP